jgi:serine/threonine protein kinase
MGRREDDGIPRGDAMAALFPELEILGVLGRGGMGVVYRARQRRLDRIVALKVLLPEVAAQPGFPERFEREARAMAALDHPNVVRVFDFGDRKGTYYLLMEHVEGTSLRAVIREGGLDPRIALSVVRQICDALEYAHGRGVVHRDVKPENVLLEASGRVRIADFGLAKLARFDASGTLTRSGQVMGTVPYIAPEQVRTPQEVDHRADLYSLGVVFYEMLTGELPMGRFDRPSERVRVDVRLDDVVLRALERERDRRYQQASEIRTDVDALGAAAAVPPVPPRPRNVPALLGFLLGSVALAWVLIVIAARERLLDEELVWMAALAAAGAILAGIGWIRTMAGHGRKGNRPFAIAGVACGVVALALLATDLPSRWERYTYDRLPYHPYTPPSEAEKAAQMLLSRLSSIQGEALPLEQALVLVPPPDRDRIREMDPDERDRQRRAGTLGLALIHPPEDDSGGTVPTSGPHFVSAFATSDSEAVIQAFWSVGQKDPRYTSLHPEAHRHVPLKRVSHWAEIVRVEGRWYFAVSPVTGVAPPSVEPR